MVLSMKSRIAEMTHNKTGGVVAWMAPIVVMDQGNTDAMAAGFESMRLEYNDEYCV